MKEFVPSAVIATAHERYHEGKPFLGKRIVKFEQFLNQWGEYAVRLVFEDESVLVLVEDTGA